MLDNHVFFWNRDDHAAGSCSRQDLDRWVFHPMGEREGREENEDMVRLREQLSAATEELRPWKQTCPLLSKIK